MILQTQQKFFTIEDETATMYWGRPQDGVQPESDLTLEKISLTALKHVRGSKESNDTDRRKAYELIKSLKKSNGKWSVPNSSIEFLKKSISDILIDNYVFGQICDLLDDVKEPENLPDDSPTV